jgi:hypothetical protein
MPDIALKPDDWKKFNQGLEAQTADHSGGGELSPWVQAPIDYMKGQFVGAGKAAAGIIPESIAPKAVHDFATSPGDPNSMAERAGESVGDFGASVLPGYFMPGWGIAEKLGNVALRARSAGNIAQKGYGRALKAAKWLEGTVQGTEAGALEAKKQTKTPEEAIANTERGAVTGGMAAAELAAGKLAFEAMPPWAQKLSTATGLGVTAAGGGALLWDKLGHHHFVPYHILSALAAPLLGLAGAATRVNPGIVGAASERAGQLSGYEPGGSAPADTGPQDEIISR